MNNDDGNLLQQRSHRNVDTDATHRQWRNDYWMSNDAIEVGMADEMTATLKIRRERLGIQLRRGTFHAFLDNNELGSIEWQHEAQWPIEPGQHTLQMKAGRYISQRRTFQTVDGAIVNLDCNGARIWPLYLASILKPDLAISLGFK